MGGPLLSASVVQQPESKEETSSVQSTTSFPRQRSRGQLARRNSITKGSDGGRHRRRGGTKRANAMLDARHPTSPSSIGREAKTERPWLGGLFFTDLIFIAFTYTINLLRTCGLAELADVVFKGLAYVLTQLLYDLYQRWTLSTPPPAGSDKVSKSDNRKLQRRRRKVSKVYKSGSSSESDTQEAQHQPLAFTSSYEPEPEYTLPHSPDQLSPFHHIIILLVKFAASNFPHLLPRVLFAEETIGPFVYWRTGGGSNAMVQEFTNLQERQPSAKLAKETSDASSTGSKQITAEPAFRAYLISKDARLPIEVQRSNLASRRATTLLYLHGGGFSLGSVAFYAEALLRIRAKVCALEALDSNEDIVAEARCVAVEYDLSPAARFPLPLLQCLRCYAHLIEVEKIDPNSICIAGDSAGGNLAMGLLLCLDGQMKSESFLAERDWSKLPMPGKALLISPWVDLRPSHAHAFSMLRESGKTKRASKNDKEKAQGKGKDIKSQSKGWTDAVAAYDWDYVASEALLHFAQVYTGVLPHPRRVRGPIGWIAHVCDVVANEYGGEEQEEKENHSGFMGPVAALSGLVGPSKRLAQATHDVLSDPFLSKLFGAGDIDTPFGQEGAKNQQAVDIPTIGSGSKVEPLFTAFDRKTDLVAGLGNLFEPIQHQQFASDKIGKAKGTAEQERLRAGLLLDSHPLLSPAIGDWANIRLKGGILVTWGERERMAKDIEAWVDNVYQNDVRGKDVPPAQDGESQAKYNHKKMQDEEDFDLPIETAVERGPGGVHAWPFVSMYLAGSEAERERGLDLLADFIARSLPMEVATPGSQTMEDPLSKMIDPPHAAPDSPISETASVGSMPSDVDLHGMIEEDFYHGSTSSVDIVEAVRKANEKAFQDSLAEQAVSKSKERIVSTVQSKASKTPPQQQSKVKSSLGVQAQRSHLPRIMTEKERGRSRSPRRTEGIKSNLTPSFVSSVQLHRPDTIHNQSSPSSSSGMSALPQWWVAPVQSEAQVTKGVPKQDEDIQASEDMSNSTTSAPKQDEQDLTDEKEETIHSLGLAPLNISHSGLSQFAIRRPEPEGLSDIAEEGSVLSASVTSAGVTSRSMSPDESRYGGRGDNSPQTSLTAASMVLQENDFNRSRWPVEEDEEEGERERINPFDVISPQASSSPRGSPDSINTTREKSKGEVWW